MATGSTRRLARSIRFRLTTVLGLIATVVFTVAGSTLYLALARELEAADRNELHGKELLISHYIEEASGHGNLAELEHQVNDALVAHGDLRVWLLSSDGSIVLGAGELPRETGRDDSVLTLRAADGSRLEGVRTAVTAFDPLPIASMLVTIEVGPRLRLLGKYRWTLSLVCLAAVLTTIVLADLAIRRGLLPARRLSGEAARISPASLSLRLDASNVDAELEDLVHGFNAALDRVEAAYRKIESFNADVAHELRTPLATLINAAQVTLADQRSAQALRETLTDQLEELEQLKNLVNDMLFLARADRGDSVLEARTVELADEIHKTVDFYEALLADAGLRVTVEGAAEVTCNDRLVRRAVANLLSNAIKQTERGATLKFRLVEHEGFALIELFNPGPPIPEEVRSRMFDRFFRADASRSRLGPGHGLGLAIVRAIAEMHGGWTFARCDAGGNTVGFAVRAGHGHEEAMPTSAASINA